MYNAQKSKIFRTSLTCFQSGRVLFKLPLRMFKFLTLGVHYLKLRDHPKCLHKQVTVVILIIQTVLGSDFLCKKIHYETILQPRISFRIEIEQLKVRFNFQQNLLNEFLCCIRKKMGKSIIFMLKRKFQNINFAICLLQQ